MLDLGACIEEGDKEVEEKEGGRPGRNTVRGLDIGNGLAVWGANPDAE